MLIRKFTNLCKYLKSINSTQRVMSLSKRIKSDKDFCNQKTDSLDARDIKFAESDVFITEFIGGHKGFVADFKQRFSDFIVHEILDDVVRLSDLGENFVSLNNEKSHSQDTHISYEIKKQLEQLVAGEIEEVNIEAKNLEKEERKQIHLFIRENYKGLESTFVNKEDKQIIKVKKLTRLIKIKRNFYEWPSDRPEFVHFSLYQENRGTFQALLKLQAVLNINSKEFGIAGTKDKRSISTQKVSIKKIDPMRLLKLNEVFSKDNNPICVGNIEFKDKPLFLGGLKGNYFNIVLRDVEATENDINEACESLVQKGFINYFGTQRFGMNISSSYKVGLAMLSEDWLGAINAILVERPKDKKSENPKYPMSFNECMRLWSSTRDANEVYRNFSWKNSIEGLILKGLVKCKQEKNYVAGFSLLARNSKSLYLHAYQSYIWNQLATFRIKKYGIKVIPGDLVLSNADNEKSPIVVNETELDNFNIFDIVIPLPASDIVLPKNDVGDYLIQLLNKDSINFNNFKKFRSIYNLKGGYRKLIEKPQDLSMEIVTYNNNEVKLFQTDLDVIRNIPLVSQSGTKTAVKLSFALNSSCYASVLIRELTKRDLIDRAKL